MAEYMTDTFHSNTMNTSSVSSMYSCLTVKLRPSVSSMYSCLAVKLRPSLSSMYSYLAVKLRILTFIFNSHTLQIIFNDNCIIKLQHCHNHKLRNYIYISDLQDTNIYDQCSIWAKAHFTGIGVYYQSNCELVEQKQSNSVNYTPDNRVQATSFQQVDSVTQKSVA